MKNLYKYLFIGLLIFSNSIYAQNTKKVKKKYPYLLYVPKDCQKPVDGFPLVIYLHGASCKGSNINKLKKYGLPYYVSKGKQYNFIIASPQCPSNKSWLSENWFEPLFAELLSKYNIDKSRVYVVGMSMGGYGAWHLAMDYPDKITALIPLCGGCYDSAHISKISKIPIWAFHGVLDKAIPVDETERLIRILMKCNANIKYTRLEERGHNIANIFGNQEIYDWLLEQKKS